MDVSFLITRGHHARCYGSKATDRYLLLPKRGVEFVDLTGQEHSRHNWLRGACRFGLLPSNGLLYSTPHPCFCYAGVKLGGFLALASERERTKDEGQSRQREGTGQRQRLERGPAFCEASLRRLEFTVRPSTTWPMYRHDAKRSGSTTTVVGPDVTPVWQAELGGKLTQPVVAAGRVFVARVDAGQVCCLEADTGQRIWDYQAGGRIDSSPSWFAGRLIFGSADGYLRRP